MYSRIGVAGERGVGCGSGTLFPSGIEAGISADLFSKVLVKWHWQVWLLDSTLRKIWCLLIASLACVSRKDIPAGIGLFWLVCVFPGDAKASI